MNKKMKKITAAGVSGLMAAGLMAGCVEYASHTFREGNRMAVAAVSEKEETEHAAGTGKKADTKKAGTSDKISKEETVYINADASGTVKDITVSEWLKTTGVTGSVEDFSELSDISNVKGDEGFTQSDGRLTWDAKGQDIYYQGKTGKELPVTVHIAYSLDGEEMEPQDMVGKSGKMEMKVSYENNEKRTITVNGEEEEVSVPFMLVTGMFLPTDTFANVEVDNGRVVSEGSNNIVVGIGMPGLAKSLDFSKDAAKKIPDAFTVTADVTEFSMGNTITYATSSLLGELEFDDMEDLDDLTDSIDTLTDSSAQLVSGSRDLEDGISKLASKYTEFDRGIVELADGIHKLAEGGTSLKKGALAYIDGVGSLGKGTTEYVNGTKTLAKGVKKYVKGNKELAEGIGSLKEEVEGFPSQYQTFLEGLKKYINGVKTLTNPDTMSQLSNGSAELSGGISAINEGAEKLSGGVDTIHDGLVWLEQSYANNEAMIAQLKNLAAAAQDSETKAACTALAANLEELTRQQKAGITELKENTASDSALKTGIQAIASQTSKQGALKAGAAKLAAGMGEMAGATTELYTASATLEDAGTKVGEGIGSVSAAVGQLADGAQELTDNNAVLKKGAGKLENSGKELKSGAKELTANSRTLRGGIRELLQGIRKLDNGGERIRTASTSLSEGIGKLQEGSRKLKSGMIEFDNKGIHKIDEIVNDDLLSLKERFEALADASGDYSSFSGIAGNMEGDVKFLYETEAVKAEEK